LGGAAADLALLETGRARGWKLLTTYGMTETCSQIATQLPEELDQTPLERVTSLPLLPGFEVRIVDDGIQVRSQTLLTTYQPLGAHPDPRTADGWLVTQDLGRIDSRGRLEVLGRRDDLIVSGGEKVMPVEVERVIASCTGVRSACVFGLADGVWGQLVAAAIVLEGQLLNLAELRAAILTRLSSHQRPRRLAILDELPLTAAGKVDRRALARLTPERLTTLEFS
jgi:O-succinylbenzoic acid--CoA ligase